MNLTILIIDDDPPFLTFVQSGLSNHGQIFTANTYQAALSFLKKENIDIVFLDINLGKEDGLKVLQELKTHWPQLDVVMVSAHREPKIILGAIRQGASDYLLKPFDIEEMQGVLEKIKPKRLMQERHEAWIESCNLDLEAIIGNSPPFLKLLKQVELLKGHAASVLIEAESGTGKEMLARLLHQQEGNSVRPFVTVNCAAIPDNLMESEFFGHERGAFTGADSRKIGKFELAQGGDIFLDEISSLKWDLQAKLLRVLQQKEIQRLGGEEVLSVDFRVIAATNENLEKLVQEGKFRQDLYYRLRVIPLKIPPLRERKEDIPLLTEHFLKKYSPHRNRNFDPKALAQFQNYPWPGNIRELEHVIQSLVILTDQDSIRLEDLPHWLWIPPSKTPIRTQAPFSKSSLKEHLSETEKEHVLRILDSVQGDKGKAANLLDISRTGLYERLKNWGIKS